MARAATRSWAPTSCVAPSSCSASSTRWTPRGACHCQRALHATRRSPLAARRSPRRCVLHVPACPFAGLRAVRGRGLSTLSGLMLHARVDKAQQTSHWGNRPLSAAQHAYAAVDACACAQTTQQRVYCCQCVLRDAGIRSHTEGGANVLLAAAAPLQYVPRVRLGHFSFQSCPCRSAGAP